jgi:hypothetical protein
MQNLPEIGFVVALFLPPAAVVISALALLVGRRQPAPAAEPSTVGQHAAAH